jgi:predicted alpha/beta-hydrolase family hydrolase
MHHHPTPLTIPLPGGGVTSGLLEVPATKAACYVFAHGAGAGMKHAFMSAVAGGLAERGIATLPGVRGLVFVGFPLHPAGKPSVERAEHLAQVQLPMLFLQGTRDTLADLELIRRTTAQLGARASLQILEGADHSFHVLVRSGRTDEQVVQELLDVMARWMKSC